MKYLSLTLLTLFLSPIGWAQAPSSPERPQSPTTIDRTGSTVFVAPDEDYRLSPGDTIEITVADAPELSQTFVVSANGAIEMPFLGRIVVHGLSAGELTKLIAEKLRAEDYLKSPQVRIAVKQYNSQTYFIQGSVRSPGVYQLAARPSLVKLISLAGGLAENHGPVAVILRPKKPAENLVAAVGSAVTADLSDDNDSYDLIKVNLAPLFQLGRFEKNFRIQPGDIISIPPANVFYVAGEVNAPGAFQLKEGTTLRQAIALAQGTTFKAKLSKGVIFRDDPATGVRREIRIDVKQVMSGKKEDLTLQANDIIIVPNSGMKSFSGAFLTALGVNMARLPVRY